MSDAEELKAKGNDFFKRGHYYEAIDWFVVVFD